MKINFVTLRHTHRHGDEPIEYFTEDAARCDLIETVTTSWDNIFCVDGADCGVEGCTGVPRDPDTLERDEAIRIYFAHNAGCEWFVIEDHELDVDLTKHFGALIRDLNAALAISGNEPGSAVRELRAVAQRAVAELTGTPSPAPASW